MTLLPGAPWRDLEPTDPTYELFRWAYLRQDSWDSDDHEAFWRASLSLWPRKTGQRQMTDQLTQWAIRLKAHGADNGQIEAATGYAKGSLARMGVLRNADDAIAAWSSIPVSYTTMDQAMEDIGARRAQYGPARPALVRWMPLITPRGAPRIPAGVTMLRLSPFMQEGLSDADCKAIEHVDQIGERALARWIDERAA